MQVLLYISIFAGVMLYITKLISYYALMAPFPRLSKYIQSSPFRLALLDLIFGFMGLHVISLAAGSVTAMFIMIVFGTCSIIYLCIMTAKIKWNQRKLREGVVHA
jgi:hypothetical protein